MPYDEQKESEFDIVKQAKKLVRCKNCVESEECGDLHYPRYNSDSQICMFNPSRFKLKPFLHKEREMLAKKLNGERE
jgi:hypothetical protein